MRQLAIRIPFIDRIRRSRNRTVRIWRVLDDDRRVQGSDKGMQVGMRRVVVVANVGLERAVCAQEAPPPSVGIDSGLIEVGYLLCNAAHRSILRRPKMAMISASASVSSFELKKGKRRVRKHRRMMPADQMSRAEQHKV